MQAMLLAAGFGTRLRPYTEIRPKPLFPVLNRPLLQIMLDRLAAIGCDRVIVNAHHLASQIAAAVAGRPGVVLQREPEILGTGGSLREALPNLADEPLLVVNGDIFCDIDLAELHRKHLASGKAVTMALHDLPRFNTVRVADDRIAGFGGAAGTGETLLAYTGIQVVNPEIIAQIPAGRFFHIIDLYQDSAQTGCLGFIRVDGAFWRDMGTPGDYLDLHRDLLKPGEWRIADGVRMPVGVRLSGWGCIGAGVVVEPGAALEDCVVWDGAHVPPGRYRGRILTGNREIDMMEHGT